MYPGVSAAGVSRQPQTAVVSQISCDEVAHLARLASWLAKPGWLVSPALDAILTHVSDQAIDVTGASRYINPLKDGNHRPDGPLRA